MGCRYDHIAVDWLPTMCFDGDLVEEFDRSGPGTNGAWQYYEKGTISPSMPLFIPVNDTQIDIYAGEGREYWATREWHILHCMFTWRKQFRAQFSGKDVEPWNYSEDHIKHCSSYIMGAMRVGRRLDDIETQIVGTDRHLDE